MDSSSPENRATSTRWLSSEGDSGKWRDEERGGGREKSKEEETGAGMEVLAGETQSSALREVLGKGVESSSPLADTVGSGADKISNRLGAEEAVGGGSVMVAGDELPETAEEEDTEGVG